MGLSAFSRARVSQLPEMELEVERFVEWNRVHQQSFRDLDELHSKSTEEERLQRIRDTAAENVKVIGEKVVAGLQENIGENETIDMPLRIDHVRDMVGRRHVVDPQGEPKSMMDKLHDRIPTGSMSERLVPKTDVVGLGPTKEEVEAAEVEQQPWVNPDEVTPPAQPGDPVELPAAGHGAGVMVSEDDRRDRIANVPADTRQPVPEETRTDTRGHDGTGPEPSPEAGLAGVEKVVPPTTQVEGKHADAAAKETAKDKDHHKTKKTTKE
jgi:hypothetical protein